MLQLGFVFVQGKEARKLPLFLVIFVVTSHAKKPRVTNDLKGRNHISIYLDITEDSV